MVQLVGRSELPNAIALNSSLMNATRVIGPALAGALMASAGVAACFALNALSYVAVIAALSAMREHEFHAQAGSRPRTTLLHSIREGLRYALRAKTIVVVLDDAGGRLDAGDQLQRAAAGPRAADHARRPGDVRPDRVVLRRRRVLRCAGQRVAPPCVSDAAARLRRGLRARIARARRAALDRGRMRGAVRDGGVLHDLHLEHERDRSARDAAASARTRRRALSVRLRLDRPVRRAARRLARRTQHRSRLRRRRRLGDRHDALRPRPAPVADADRHGPRPPGRAAAHREIIAGARADLCIGCRTSRRRRPVAREAARSRRRSFRRPRGSGRASRA